MPVISTTTMTARQFLQLGEDPPGIRLELVDGDVAVGPSPFPRHSRVDKHLTRMLLNHIVANGLGELLGDTDTISGKHDVRRPDLLYFTKARQHLILEDQAINGPPDLCIEIVSPSSSTVDRKDKFKQYAVGGVEYYWIVDPVLKTIEAYQRSGNKYKLLGRGKSDAVASFPPFADLKIPLGDIWFPQR